MEITDYLALFMQFDGKYEVAQVYEGNRAFVPDLVEWCAYHEYSGYAEVPEFRFYKTLVDNRRIIDFSPNNRLFAQTVFGSTAV
ncbi:hypothetical protein Tco_0328973 [Tanacetum coccineum]